MVEGFIVVGEREAGEGGWEVVKGLIELIATNCEPQERYR